LQKVPDLSKLYNFKKEDIQKDMWAGLSMGGGNFNPNVTNSNSNTALLANNEAMDLSDPNLTAANQSKISSLTSVSETPSVAYNVGLGFGKYLSKRWLLESGVEYTKYSSEAKSNLSYNKNQNSTAFVWNTNGSDFSFDNLENTTTYTLSNNYEYVSIPINFGYVLLKKQIGIIVTSGFATDLFLSNKVVDQSGNLETNVQRNGDASPFRPININALVGGELFYTWNQHYVISIDPGYRYSLTGITKSDTQFSSRPTSLFIGFKFKYLIN